MTKRIMVIIMIVLGFAVVMVMAVWGYKSLSSRYRPDVLPDATANVTGGATAAATDNTAAAPDFAVYDAGGKKVKLSDYRGVPVVLNFWASWCPPCKNEMPHFQKVSEEYKANELVFLMVDLVDGDRETVETGKEYIQDQGYTFTVLFDIKGDAGSAYAIENIPTTFFINKDGRVVAYVEGGMDQETLRKGVGLITE